MKHKNGENIIVNDVYINKTVKMPDILNVIFGLTSEDHYTVGIDKTSEYFYDVYNINVTIE